MLDLDKHISVEVRIGHIKSILNVIKLHNNDSKGQSEISKSYDAGMLTAIRSFFGDNEEIKQLLKQYGF